MHCCVPGCKFLKKKPGKVSLFRPKNLEQLSKWQEALPSVQVTKDSRVCSKHFLKSDILTHFPKVVLTSEVKSVVPVHGTRNSHSPRTETELLRTRPGIIPTAVPVLLLGGNTPKAPVRTSKKKKKGKKNSDAGAKDERVLNPGEYKALLCKCQEGAESCAEAVDVTMEYYLSRVADVTMPSAKWKTFRFKKKVFLAHLRKIAGELVADKVLLLEEGRNPVVILNGVKFMETSFDVHLEELLVEINSVKACIGPNVQGQCTGINRTNLPYCRSCLWEKNNM